MPLTREKYDGDFYGRSISDTTRRSSINSESQVNKYASSKRTKKNSFFLNEGTKYEDNEHDKDRYLLTYSDVITLLLGLFIILYAISNIDLKKYEKFKNALESSFGNNTKVINVINKSDVVNVMQEDNLKSHLISLIKVNGYSNKIKLEENARGLTIHIMDEILFSSGKADLSESSKNVLDKLATILMQIKNDLRIEGHTDNIPINSSGFASNWHLSVARALNTAYYLIKDESLAPERVSIVGYSEYKPIASNKTEDGRAQNRRVDIVIIRK